MRTPARILESTGFVRALLAAACLAAYGNTLLSRDFIRDDQWLISANPVLRQGLAAVPRILTSGYLAPVEGDAAPIHEYRPVLSLSFLFHYLTTGPAPGPMHAGNVLLHLLVCLLLYELLLRRMGPTAAAAGALLYAVMPVHTEVVSYLTSRSELLSAAAMLGAWLALDGRAPRVALGAGLFGLGLLSKEHAILFPGLLIASDWVFHGERPWGEARRPVYAALAATALLYLGVRAAVLPASFHGGVPYFPEGTPALVPALTLAVFAVRHYAAPCLTGAGLCADYSRPLIPDADLGSPVAWLALLAWTALFAAAARACLRRRTWGFWVAAPCLFLLPTSNLILPLDTLGAERFLYIPTMGLAALAGALYERAAARAIAPWLGAGLLLWYGAATVERNRDWGSALRFYEQLTRCNPVYADGRSALGAARIASGDPAAGQADLEAAVAMKPESAHPYYNLGLLAWQRQDFGTAESQLRKCLERAPRSADALSLLALVLEARGRLDEAEGYHRKALETIPWNPLAHYNLGRHYMMRGQRERAAAHFEDYLRLDPRDADAPATRALVAQLRGKRR